MLLGALQLAEAAQGVMLLKATRTQAAEHGHRGGQAQASWHQGHSGVRIILVTNVSVHIFLCAHILYIQYIIYAYVCIFKMCFI